MFMDMRSRLIFDVTLAKMADIVNPSMVLYFKKEHETRAAASRPYIKIVQPLSTINGLAVPSERRYTVFPNKMPNNNVSPSPQHAISSVL
jgi:hypothetical protein